MRKDVSERFTGARSWMAIFPERDPNTLRTEICKEIRTRRAKALSFEYDHHSASETGRRIETLRNITASKYLSHPLSVEPPPSLLWPIHKAEIMSAT